jgi:hypothetical protein
MKNQDSYSLYNPEDIPQLEKLMEIIKRKMKQLDSRNRDFIYAESIAKEIFNEGFRDKNKKEENNA